VLAAAALACLVPAAGLLTRAAEPGHVAAASAKAKVNVNRADLQELQTLPGIGPALAKRIVEFRREYGPFESVEELIAVKGIGPKLLAKLRPHVFLGEENPR
jgi:competence protein ComEA